MDRLEHAQLNEKKWDKWSRTFDNKWAAPFRYLQKRVISLAGLKTSMHFLDIGCGTGWAVRYAASLLKGQGSFTGVDISEGMITKAKENAAGMDNVGFYRGNAEELPLESNFFDVIICTFSFHHYFNPEKALSEVSRVLKPGGRYYILDITTDDPITNGLLNFLPHMLQKTHVKQYNTVEYKKMFAAAGFKYVESKTIFMYPIKVNVGEK